MKRSILISFLVVFFCFSLVGCDIINAGGKIFNPSQTQGTQPTSKTTTTEVSVKEDLQNYYKGIQGLADLEETALNSYNSVTGEKYTNDTAMYQKMKTVTVPKYTEFVQKLEKLKPKTDKVQEAHTLYVTGANFQLEAFMQILTALEMKDSALIEQANDKLAAGRETIGKFREKIEALAAAYKVNIILPDTPSSSSRPSVSVADDLIDYINVELGKLTTLENEALSAYRSVSGSNYTNDNTMLNAMVNTVVPKYQQFLNILQSIKPQTKEVSNIHQTYVDGAKLQMEAFNLIVEALKKKDSSLITAANNKLSQGTSLINQFNSDLEALAKKNNVTIK